MAKKIFDFAIGNPPYQEEAPGTSTSDKPVYHQFMDAAFDVADKVELITPARFLFNAGATPSAWNKKMLSDPHFKVLRYEADYKKIFPGAIIVGGLAITYHNNDQEYGTIGTFTAFQELNTILQKVISKNQDGTLDSIIYTQNKFNLDVLNQDLPGLNRRDKRLESNIFGLSVFTEEPATDECYRILGLYGNKRVYRYIDSKYIDDSQDTNISKFKIIVSKSNGASGSLGNEPARLITLPVIEQPNTGYTRTFIGIGSFDVAEEADAALKYIKSKFCRVLLGVLKVTQDNNPDKWRYVPLQDFTSSSDIDWSKSIHEIDLQLYRKYGLSVEEINFIETHVKEMV